MERALMQEAGGINSAEYLKFAAVSTVGWQLTFHCHAVLWLCALCICMPKLIHFFWLQEGSGNVGNDGMFSIQVSKLWGVGLHPCMVKTRVRLARISIRRNTMRIQYTCTYGICCGMAGRVYLCQYNVLLSELSFSGISDDSIGGFRNILPMVIY
jgi:hypothetical protein